MFRTCAIAVFSILAFAGCSGPELVPIPPLPVEGQAALYGDLLTRLRTHSDRANEAFFRDDFEALAGRARDIENTAGHLPRAAAAPKEVQPRLAEESARFIEDARALAADATTKNDDRIRTSLRKIHTRIRTLPEK